MYYHNRTISTINLCKVFWRIFQLSAINTITWCWKIGSHLDDFLELLRYKVLLKFNNDFQV